MQCLAVGALCFTSVKVNTWLCIVTKISFPRSFIALRSSLEPSCDASLVAKSCVPELSLVTWIFKKRSQLNIESRCLCCLNVTANNFRTKLTRNTKLPKYLQSLQTSDGWNEASNENWDDCIKIYIGIHGPSYIGYFKHIESNFMFNKLRSILWLDYYLSFLTTCFMMCDMFAMMCPNLWFSALFLLVRIGQYAASIVYLQP